MNGTASAFEASAGDRGTLLADFVIARSDPLSSTPHPSTRSFNGVVIFRIIQAD